MNFFTDENITEPLVRYYKDFSYVEYIMNLSFRDGFKLYLKCIDLIKEEKEVRDNISQLWLVEIQHGYEGDFESYYKSQISGQENKILGKDFRDSEEKRILEKIERKKNVKLKERVFNL